MAPRTPRATLDADRVSARLRQVADEIILPRHRKLGEGDISEKEHGELVTVADIETEHWLSRELLEVLPGSVVVGEEATYADPRIFKRLRRPDPVWVIDPIDGTHNFAHGKDVFAVIVGLVVAGEAVAGWIYEPVGGILAVGEQGAGVAVDDRPVTLGGQSRAQPCHGVAARQLFARAEADQTFIDRVDRPNCAGHEYIQLLRGERSFTAYTRLLPWDHAAGSFIVREAGGVSALLEGSPYDVARSQGNLLSADTEQTWRRVQKILADDSSA